MRAYRCSLRGPRLPEGGACLVLPRIIYPCRKDPSHGLLITYVHVLRRYSTSGVSESVTVESRRPGACLLRKMKRFMSPKCHALLLDEGELGMNSRHKVLLNV